MLKLIIKRIKTLGLMSLFLGCAGCDDHPWNDPYPYEKLESNTYYSAFTERPNHLDPARSYSEPEWSIICQIYEPPLQYHYLKRPYQLQPLTAVALPEVHYFDKNNNLLSDNATSDLIAYTDYIIRIKPGIFYQMHPAFAKTSTGKFHYHSLSKENVQNYRLLSDFKERDTRELIAEDYVYQIKRLAEPHLSSPIFGFMSRYILGLKALREELLHKALTNSSRDNLEIDLRSYTLQGVSVIDRYTYRIRIIGKYPQFRYWLAMPFFAPIPWEVATFYAQEGLDKHNISLDWYPLGSGPFELSENNPERRMVLIKNLKFREEHYPSDGSPQDASQGYLQEANETIPMLEKVIFSLEKEDIPYWDKFLQGYYDISGISSDNFNSAVHFNSVGNVELNELLRQRNIRLETSVYPEIWYWGFNMLDEVVGGNSEKSRKLRQAIQLAFDVEEFISIFLNGRGVVANGPIPPDIFGFNAQPKANAKNILKARQLLKEANYSQGLTLYFDTVISGDPNETAIQAWLQKQFSKIGLHVVMRGTDYNRFQEKIHSGIFQMFFAGWKADYPDPENFLFLLYGPNGSVRSDGENISNYSNPQYDQLFEKMRGLADNSERVEIIQKMLEIIKKDVPWFSGFYPNSFNLYHQWVAPEKSGGIINNTLKYIKLDPSLRAKQRIIWNQPILWPIWIILGLVTTGIIGLFTYFRKKECKLPRVL